MIPFILAIAGGFLIGSCASGESSYASGGKVSGKFTKKQKDEILDAIVIIYY